MLYHNHFWSMWCYNSYQLIFDTAIAPKSGHRIKTVTYIRLYLTQADLQINVRVKHKIYNCQFFYKYLSFATNAWVFFL